MVYIYVLQLEQNKFYIGKTSQPDIRIDSHFESSGSMWTKKYKPIKLLELIENCDNYDEDKHTIRYMAKYGISGVRGGSFSEIELTDETKKIIGRMIDSYEDRCFRCHKKGHLMTFCRVKIPSNIEPDGSKDEIGCKYCDKSFTSRKGTRYHENFFCQKNPKRYRRCDDCGSEHKNRAVDYCNNCKMNIFKGKGQYKGKNYHWIMKNDLSWCAKVYRGSYFKNSPAGDSFRNYLRTKNFDDGAPTRSIPTRSIPTRSISTSTSTTTTTTTTTTSTTSTTSTPTISRSVASTTSTPTISRSKPTKSTRYRSKPTRYRSRYRSKQTRYRSKKKK